MKYKGEIAFRRYLNGPRVVDIEITDGTSHIVFLEASLSMEAFADILLGCGQVDCTFELCGLDKIGMIAENKSELVPMPSPYSIPQGDAGEKIIDEALKPFEVDGWLARRQDCRNGHCARSGGLTEVVFYRYVPAGDLEKLLATPTAGAPDHVGGPQRTKVRRKAKA